jgi:hypothetical protein
MSQRPRKTSFWKTLPGILTAAAGFITAVVGLLAALQQLKGKDTGNNPSPDPKQISSGTGSNATTHCEVSGFVYNLDTPSLAGLPNVELAYIPSAPTNASPVRITTTSPTGKFSFDCDHISMNEFPIHLQMIYSWPGKNQIVQSDDQIFIAGNSEMNLYLSPRDITNWHRLNNAVLHVSSAKLLQGKFSTLTATGSAARLPTNGVAVVPKSVHLPKEFPLHR